MEPLFLSTGNPHMNKTKRTISITLLLLHNLQLLLWSALLVIMPERIFQVSFGTFAGRSWTRLRAVDEELVRYVGYYARFWGIQGLMIGMILTFICFTAYRKLEKWARLLVLIAATIGWGSAAALDIVLKDFLIVWFDIIPLLMVYASLLLSTRSLSDLGPATGE
jgi:hypothetical protein